ncbi:MAG TPA: trigger factor, partial [Phycicoccus sp.]|nr:trigger factor [Phycicoccus sp.]
MKSAVESLSPTRVKLTVEVPFDELKPDLDKAYKTIASQVNIPGFRKGKVPSRIIDQRFGRGAVVQEAVNEALPRFYQEAAEAESLKVIGRPEVEVTAVPLEDGEDFTFSVETDVRPEITLPDLDGIAIEVDDVAVSEDDVQERLTQLQERFGTLVGVDRAVEDGDHVSIDLSAKIGDTDIDAVEGVSYEVGS